MHIPPATVGVVIIGRNEGNRLIACLDSLVSLIPQVVYVDSGSTDNSLIEAVNRGAHTVSLDITQPFTAARARNAGFDKLVKLFPSVEFVQFVDGDCVVNPKWISTAYDFLIGNAKVAVVCGRRRELYPQKSIYNDLCDHEWNTPIGEAKACGGDALMRVNAFKFVDGYKASLIAGEEPELCIRIRQAGYAVWRIDAEMTLHDAGMTKFSQWWKRAVRAGYAFAEGAYLYGSAPEYHWVAESKRSWVWGFVIPLIVLFMLVIHPLAGCILLLIYPLQILRLTFKSKQKNKEAFLESIFMIIGKFAEAMGQIKFWCNLYFKQKSSIIEYK
ncbi:MAG: glycosyl transferase [Proteobacteria bacterium ST_bin12]|nr:MAG: glycosyl transferase [Proteobacteria bacterium ST_bin12]